MKINQSKFYEALHSALAAYRCYYTQNRKYYTAEEEEAIKSEIQLLKYVVDEMTPWVSEEIMIEEMPF